MEKRLFFSLLFLMVSGGARIVGAGEHNAGVVIPLQKAILDTIQATEKESHCIGLNRSYIQGCQSVARSLIESFRFYPVEDSIRGYVVQSGIDELDRIDKHSKDWNKGNHNEHLAASMSKGVSESSAYYRSELAKLKAKGAKEEEVDSFVKNLDKNNIQLIEGSSILDHKLFRNYQKRALLGQYDELIKRELELPYKKETAVKTTASKSTQFPELPVELVEGNDRPKLVLFKNTVELSRMKRAQEQSNSKKGPFFRLKLVK